MPTYRLHSTAGDDLGLLEHSAPNLEPGDVVELPDGLDGIVSARVETDDGAIAALLRLCGRSERAGDTRGRARLGFSVVRWFRRRSEDEPSPRPDELAEESFEVGGDRIVFWKTKEQVDGVDYGPIWIADANDPNVTLEETDLWLTWEQAEEFARKRGLPLEDV